MMALNAQPQQPQGFGGYGTAPSPGTLKYTTGIDQKKSFTPEQGNQWDAIWQGLGHGQAPGGPLTTALAGQGGAQQPAVNEGLKMLQQQAGAQGGNKFAQTKSVGEAGLAASQDAAQSQAGLGMQKALGDQYASQLGMLAEGNTAAQANQVRLDRLKADLWGNLFGGLTGGSGLLGSPAGGGSSFGSNFGMA